MTTRTYFLDLETTGLEPERGHRIIEICLLRPGELTLTARLDPERDIDASAQSVHGIRRAELIGCPRFPDIIDGLVQLLFGQRIIIHNAPFDLGFLDAELARMGWDNFQTVCRCEVVDSLKVARRRLPGRRHSLNDLCDRFGIDRSERTVHGALVDCTLLARVWHELLGLPGAA